MHKGWLSYLAALIGGGDSTQFPSEFYGFGYPGIEKIISRPIGVGTTKGLLVSPNIGYNNGIFVCCHHFIYCWLQAIHFYRIFAGNSTFAGKVDKVVVSSRRIDYSMRDCSGTIKLL